MTSSKHEQLSMSWSDVTHFQVWGMYWSCAGVFFWGGEAMYARNWFVLVWMTQTKWFTVLYEVYYSHCYSVLNFLKLFYRRLFCFDVGEWWMTHGPCTSEIKAVNISMNVCGSPDLLTPPLHLPMLTFHLYVNVCGIIVTLKLGPLEISGPDCCLVQGSFQSQMWLLRASQVSRTSVNAGSLTSLGNLFQSLTTLLWVYVLVADTVFVLLCFKSK